MLSGDEGICTDAVRTDSQIITVAAHKGHGDCVVANTPGRTQELLACAVNGIREKEEYRLRELPGHFHVRAVYCKHQDALKSSCYPGCRQTDGRTVEFEASDFYEVLRLFVFI